MVDEVRQAFRPRARLLQLLGDQLIGTPRLALFELVKNAYDAGASFADIEMSGLGTSNALIAVRDDGSGMSVETVQNVWLVPGHDHRKVERESARVQRENAANLPDALKQEKPPLARLPLGEKGLGRFAAHKLGNRIHLITRAANEREVVVEIDWDALTDLEFLDQGEVVVQIREPQEFVEGETGTLITITELRGEAWTRGEVRRLARQITSISSPFQEREDRFEATLEVAEHPEWLRDIPSVRDLIRRAPFTFEFKIENNTFSWQYEFHGFPNVGASPRRATGNRDGVLIDPSYLPKSMTDETKKDKRPKTVVSPDGFAEGIGPIAGKLYVFDRDRDVLQRVGDAQGIQNFLDENGGLRVYRDGIRVYNYGEPGDDWLGLDLRRVNSPSKRISNNIAIGSIDITLEASEGLREKTNREGFDENDAYARFRALVMGAVAAFEVERQKDKDIVRRLLRKAREEADRDIAKPLADLTRIAKRHGFADEISPFVKSAQENYDSMREIMLRAGTSNMTLAIVFHEVDHGVRLLRRSVEAGESSDSILQQTIELTRLLDGFGDLIRRGQIERHDLRDFATRAIALNRVRLRNHGVHLETNIDDFIEDVPAEFSMGLVLGAITNVIDNSIYWLRTKFPDESRDAAIRKMFIGLDVDSFLEGPAVIIADNGPGFVDGLGDVTRPFFSRRPDGIGIGLYYVSLIMDLCNGSIQLLDRAGSAVPPQYDGAQVALVFGGK